MPRTTIFLDDDAVRIAKEYAAQNRISFGKALSKLVLQGADRELITDMKNGFPVVRLSGRAKKVTSELVKRLSEDWP